MPKLIVTSASGGDEKVVALAAETTIGRLPESIVSLQGKGVSRTHAKIVAEEGRYYLIDLGSGNGTLLNGILVRPNEKNLLRNQDRITVENYHLKFWETDEKFEQHLKEEEELTDPDILEVKLLKKILDAVDEEALPSLEVLNGAAEGKRFFLSEDMETIVIGRDPECDFCISEEVVSRQHAKIAKKWGGIALIDNESKNGTFVNNQRITEEFLHDGDRIALGTVVLLFRNPQEINVQQLSEAMAKARPAPPVRGATLPAPQPPAETGGEIPGTQEAAAILKEIPPLRPAANVYPSPRSGTKQFSALEIGMMGLAILIFALAAITLVNLLLA